MERAAEANWRLALTDSLTGLPNRRHLARYLDRVLAHGAGRPSSLAIFDIDDFKRFNDRQGYVAGDQVLTALGAVLSMGSAARLERRNLTACPAGGQHAVERPGPNVSHRRPHHVACGCSHFAARLGGDEFVVLFADEKVGRARDAADRMARAVARHPLLSPHAITVSFGVAALDAGMRCWQDLLAAADRDRRRRRSSA